MDFNNKQKRLVYGLIFFLLVAVEVVIACFVHDRWIRPYVGDVLIVGVLYCGIRIIFPTQCKHLPRYVFLFAIAIEILQYFDYAALLGLDGSPLLAILLGSSFSLADILCYGVGCTACCIVEHWFDTSKR